MAARYASQKVLSRQFICKTCALYVKHALISSNSATKNYKLDFQTRFFSTRKFRPNSILI